LNNKDQDMLLVALIDFKVNNSVIECRKAAAEGVSVFEALRMANSVYDFDEVNSTITLVNTFLDGSIKREGSLEQIFSQHFDPRLEAIKKFAEMIAEQTDGVEKLA
jgi:hypothetical protein